MLPSSAQVGNANDGFGSKPLVPLPVRRNLQGISDVEEADKSVGLEATPVLASDEKAVVQPALKPGASIGVKMLVSKSPNGPWEVREEAAGTEGTRQQRGRKLMEKQSCCHSARTCELMTSQSCSWL